MNFFNNEILYILGKKIEVLPKKHQVNICSDCFSIDPPYCLIRVVNLRYIYDCTSRDQYFKQLKF